MIRMIRRWRDGNVVKALVVWTGICAVLAGLLLAVVILASLPPYLAAIVIPVWFLYLIGVGVIGVSWIFRRAVRIARRDRGD